MLSVGRGIFGCQRILVGNPQGTKSLTSWFQATPHEREVGMPHPRYESLCHLVRCCTKFCFKSKYFPSFCRVPQVFVLESVHLFLLLSNSLKQNVCFSVRVANGFAFGPRECGISSGSPFPLYIVVACTVCVCVGLYVVDFISLFRLVWGSLKTLLSISVANRFAFDVRESAVPSDSHIPLFIAVACMFGAM